MINTLKRLTLSLGLVFCLVACGSSPPNKYYRLTSTAALGGDNQQPALGIGPIEIPEFLNRDALVYSEGGNRLQVAGNDRWAEPLDDGIQRVMGLNLAQLLQSQHMQFFPWDLRYAPEYGVRVNVLDLDAQTGKATLVAEWVLYRPRDGSSFTRQISTFSKPLAGNTVTARELPPAYSDLLHQLSETIAAAIKADQQNKTEATGTQAES